MKKLLFFKILLCGLLYTKAQVNFNKYFSDNTLRIDYYHTGNAEKEFINLDKIYKYNKWAGNPEQCIQKSQLGEYRIKLFDHETNKLIFSKGYTTIFWEYQSTQPAKDGKNKTYHESVFVPFPKQKVICKIEKKENDKKYYPIFEFEIDPDDYHIITETHILPDNKIIKSIYNGNPWEKVDLVIIGEGYTLKEKKKFKKDLDFYIESIFSSEPFKSQYHNFNITGIMPPSAESGTDEPRQGIYKNTVLNSSFNIFDTERYILVEDNRKLQDVASQVPFDAILVMVNSDRYGGGGIYNCQATFTSGKEWKREYVFIHEFGHSFAGLADEYFSSDVSYIDFYPRGIEPVEANITAFLDPDNLKWKDLLSPGIEIPTDWNKEVFDSLNSVLSELKNEKSDTIEALSSLSASDSLIKRIVVDYDLKIDLVKKETDDFIFNHPLKDKIGVFEGAGYSSKGLYRPTINSLMHRFDKDNRSFREVNEKAILEMIKYYTGEE